jgi:hypothetical protein
MRRGLSDILSRPAYEKNLAALLSAETGKKIDASTLIIDIPEPFSFETGLFIRGKNCLFNESTSFFAGETMQSCSKTLRVVRIFIDRAVHNGSEALFQAALSRIFDSGIGVESESFCE